MTSTVPATRRPSTTDLLAAVVSAVPGGVARPGQVQMAEAASEAIRTGEHLLVQAGTGTGKSLAYLVPALLHGIAQNRGPVMVSTATLALQAQLVESDLPRLADAAEPLLGRRPTFAVLKGRHHYACLARLDAGTEEPEPDLFGDSGSGGQWLGQAGRIGKQVVRVREWAERSRTGDRDELDPGVDDQVWRSVSMPARECVGAQRCPFGDDCFAEASRVRARSADIVVTNHSLLAVDMMSGRHILPPHEVLVVDEAHELADRVTSAARAELSPDAIDRATRRIRSIVDGGVVERLTEAADGLAIALGSVTRPGRLVELPPEVRDAVSLAQAAGRAAVNAIGEVKADDPDPVRKQQGKSTVLTLAEVAERLLDCSPHDVIWVEGGGQPGHERPGLHVAPLSVAGLFASLLYQDRTVIATSATLALGGRFDTVAIGLGLNTAYGRTPATNDVRPDPPTGERTGKVPKPTRSTQPFLVESDDESADPPEWRALDVGSPFDYAKQGILYVAAQLPRPTQSGLSDPAADELVRLVGALGGRTLGLFSSRRAAERAAEVVRSRTDLVVYLQGDEALPILVRKFKAERESCLFGVMSLWQGVDVPGDACQLVVIDRLPFPRPDEPLAAARSAAVDAGGGSGFAAVSVPVAAVRLAQGVGRLVRASSDRGVVAVLDPRLHTARSYGGFLRDSLPPFWYTTNREVVHGALTRLAST
nr:ATP-dependent DNA helicase [Actinocatenispora rupis]